MSGVRSGSRIGILGGTFDPPHIGHLAVAVEVRHALDLDRVVLVAANQPWQKHGRRAISPAADRLAMVAASVEGLDGIEADDREIRRGGPSYTIDTLEELGEEDPSSERFVVVGSDAASTIDTWTRADDLSRSATFVVVPRPGAPGARPDGFRWLDVKVLALAVSSTDIRARVAAGRPIDVLVAPGAVTYIEQHELYRGRG